MVIDIILKYSQRGIITRNYIEEKVQCCDVESALNTVSTCLKYMKKNCDTAINVSVGKTTIAVYPDSYTDWENGIVAYRKSEGINSDGEQSIAFSKVKKLYKDWLNRFPA